MTVSEFRDPWVLLSALPWVLLFAWTARRLLGVRRVTGGRLLLSAVAGYAGGLLFAFLVSGGPQNPSFAWIGCAFAVVLTMVAIVGMELFGQTPRRRPLPGRPALPHPIRAIRRRLEDASRLRQITAILMRHGLGPALGLARGASAAGPSGDDLACRARLALEEAGGAFVKVGQLLSTRVDLIPASAAAEFARLQDSARPAEPAAVRALLDADLGRPVAGVFDDFDWQPIGSASIAQAYTARLHSGECVVVKVQRPGVAESVGRDLRILQRLARMVEAHTDWGAAYGVVAVVNDFAARLREELDFRVEARNAADIAAALASHPDVYLPRVYPQLCTARVLVLERLPGSSVGRLGDRAVDRAVDRAGLADTLLRAELEPMISGAVFHGDPHPGNVFVLPDGRLGLIDFGAAGRLNALERASITQLLTALRDQDPVLLREALFEVATPPPDIDLRHLDRGLAQVMALHLGTASVPDAGLFTDLLAVFAEFGITLPAGTTAMFRALVTLQGTIQTLCPDYPLLARAERLGGALITEHLTPGALGEVARQELLTIMPMLRRAPRHLDRLATLAERGDLALRVRLLTDEHDTGYLTHLAGRFLLGGAGTALGLVSAILLAAGRGPRISGDTTLLDVLGYLGLFAGIVLLLRVVLDTLGEDRR